MNKKILLTIMAILMIVALPASGQSKSKGYSGEVSFTKPEVSRKDGRLNAKFIIDLSNLKLNKQTQFTLTPMLVSADGNQMIAFEPYVVAKHTRYTMIRRKASNDDNFELPKNMVLMKGNQALQIPVEVEVPFEEWMRSASIKVDEKITGCAMCEKGQMLYALNDRMLQEIYQPSYTVSLVTPEAEPVKIRADKFSAKFNYKVGSAVLLKDFMQNAEQFDKVEKAVKNIINDNDITITGVNISSYASPEGRYKNNLLLSQRRAQSFMDYMMGTYNINDKYYKSDGRGEDWTGLVELIKKDNMDNKEAVLKIIDDTPDFDSRDAKIIAIDKGATYRYMLNNLYPELRRTDYSFTYRVKGFDVERAKEVIKVNPKKLSQNEMYLVANSYPENSPERLEVMQIAAKYFPNDPVSKLNLAATKLSNNADEEAGELLKDLKDENPFVLNNKGVYYAKTGQYQKAIDCFKKAGTAMAKENLSELMKRIESE